MTEKPTRSTAELSRELGRALEQVYMRTPDLNFDDLARLYRNLEISFLPEVSNDELLTREVKRRVSELLLYSALDKHCSFELCQGLFDEVARLGYTNLEKQASIYIIYARHCLQVGSNEEGLRLLEELAAALESELQRSEILVYRQLLQTTRDVQTQLRA